jgi:hypothetical protein
MHLLNVANRGWCTKLPTNLPASYRPDSPNLNGVGAVGWAGIAVVIAMFIFGAICWSGHSNETSPGAQGIGSSAVLNDVTSGADRTI